MLLCLFDSFKWTHNVTFTILTSPMRFRIWYLRATWLSLLIRFEDVLHFKHFARIFCGAFIEPIHVIT